MKTFLLTLLLSLFAGSISFAQSHHHHDHPSVHGMLMVGSSKIYASHLPMFHTPHDYQVILELKVSEPAKAAYLASVSQGDETVYTLVPETFVLPDMIANPKPFKAQIYKGHFERGGTVIANNVTVEISKVVYFKKFDPSEIQPEFGQYLLFGNEQEQFLAHSITAKPDFDQLMKVSVASPVAASLKSKDFLSVTFKGLANSEPITKPGTWMAETPSAPQGLPIDIATTLYFETGDLSF